MKVSKHICTFILALAICASTAINAFAVEEISKSKTITSTNKDAQIEFDETIKEDGKEYIFKRVSYEVKEKEDSSAQKKSKTEKKEHLTDKNYAWPDAITVADGGKNYTAQLDRTSVKYTSEGAESLTDTVKGTKTYTGYDKVDIPKNAVFDVKNPFTNASESVTLPLVNTDETYTWDENFQMDYLFTNYNAKRYNIAGKIFYHNDDVCPLNDDIDFVYELFGLDKENYEVISVEWDGKADTSTNSRNAKMTARRKIKTIKANYSKNHTFFGSEKFTGEATYIYNISTKSPEYSITGTAIYELKEEKKTKKTTTTTAEKETSSPTLSQPNTTEATTAEIQGDTSSTTSIVDANVSESNSDDSYFSAIDTPPSHNADKENNEKNDNGTVYIIAAVGAFLAAISLIIIIKANKRAKVFDENLQLLGSCKLNKEIDLSEFIDKTNKNITIKAGKKFIRKNRRLNIKAFGESLSYSFDGDYIEIINPNNYSAQ